jgi:hypothetical protein
VEEVTRRLVVRTEENRAQFREGFAAFAARHGLSDWEGWFSPFDDDTFALVLQNVKKYDMVLDLGAGDLRLAERARRVYAVEVSPIVLGAALSVIGFDLPRKRLKE